MSLKTFREAYYTASETVSKCTRNLAFAGIAVVWIFRAGEGVASKVPSSLIWPLLLFALALVLDLSQYFWQAAAWSIFCRMKEKEGVEEEADISAPRWINWPALVLFWAKAPAVIAGYILVVIFLWGF